MIPYPGYQKCLAGFNSSKYKFFLFLSFFVVSVKETTSIRYRNGRRKKRKALTGLSKERWKEGKVRKKSDNKKTKKIKIK